MTTPTTPREELKENEEAIKKEFLELFDLPPLVEGVSESRKNVIASLGVGVYRQGAREEREALRKSINKLKRPGLEGGIDEAIAIMSGEIDTRSIASNLLYNQAIDDVLALLSTERQNETR